jgi:hypothetical protein
MLITEGKLRRYCKSADRLSGGFAFRLAWARFGGTPVEDGGYLAGRSAVEGGRSAVEGPVGGWLIAIHPATISIIPWS